MTHSPSPSMFTGLRLGLHALFAALVSLVAVRTLLNESPNTALTLTLTALLALGYCAGIVMAKFAPHTRNLTSARLWLLGLTFIWFGLVWFAPDAAYLAFPLFFLYLHLFGRWWGITGVAVTALLAVAALGFHNGFDIGGVAGPLIGAAVAVLVGLGYESLVHESQARESLMTELLATERELAATQHESGVLAERARLSREIHDTIAQGLSGIQMLLHAAERADPDGSGIEHVRLARETAASTLSEARRFINELTPVALETDGLAGALRRLATTGWIPESLTVSIMTNDCSGVPMHVQTAILRIAQGALANVVQHAQASEATITVTAGPESVTVQIRDDGRGFDPDAIGDSYAGSSHVSFGLAATRERVEQLNGTLEIASQFGSGTTLTIELPLTTATEEA
ncbi:MAG: sensor histidine kinase [Aeromicrobium sp.]|nr:MAG: sensor histidine kinase [Aeromicrobium sp.]